MTPPPLSLRGCRQAVKQSRRGKGLTRLDKSGLAMMNGLGQLASCFVLGAQASGTDVYFRLSSFYHNRGSLNIGQPAPRGMSFGVAHTIPELSRFTANLALHRNLSASLCYKSHFELSC